MLRLHQLFKSYALLHLLTLCLSLSVVQAQYDYGDYKDFDYDEALSNFYGSHLQDYTEVPPVTDLPIVVTSSPKKENKSASVNNQEIPQQNTEPQVQSQVVSDQSQVLADQSPTEGSVVGPDVEIRRLVSQNTNAIKKIAGIMSDVVSKLSGQGCLASGESGTNTNMQALSNSIKEGFTVLVGAVQDLNSTLQHYQHEITRKVFSGTQQAATTFENDGPCPAPFFLVGTDCLYIETDHLRDFNTARQACIDMGAKLAEMDTYDDFIAAVRKMDLHSDAAIYFGGTDEDQEGVWKWLSGGMIEGLPWYEGEPNNSDDIENCVSYSVDLQSFNDVPCTDKKEYACLKK